MLFRSGITFGVKTTYKDTEIPITPHFNYEEAKEMIDSGLITIQSHTYDLHLVVPHDGENPRKGVLKLADETLEQYEALIEEDHKRITDQLHENLGIETIAMAYPYGHHAEESEKIYKELGLKATFTTLPGMNVVDPNNANSLYSLNRFEIYKITPTELLSLIG